MFVPAPAVAQELGIGGAADGVDGEGLGPHALADGGGAAAWGAEPKALVEGGA